MIADKNAVTRRAAGTRGGAVWRHGADAHNRGLIVRLCVRAQQPDSSDGFVARAGARNVEGGHARLQHGAVVAAGQHHARRHDRERLNSRKLRLVCQGFFFTTVRARVDRFLLAHRCCLLQLVAFALLDQVLQAGERLLSVEVHAVRKSLEHIVAALRRRRQE